MFFFGWQTIALSYIVFVIVSWVAYPGASMELATLFAVLGGVAIAGCYALLAAVYPRSGAEYVFLSRSLHPAVGFVLSFNFAFWQMFYIGINGALLSLFAVQPVVGAIGIQSGNQTIMDLSAWFGSPWGIFVTGGVVIVAMLLLHIRGAGKYFKWQRVASYLAMLSLAVTVVVLILASVGVLSFAGNFDAIAGDGAYQGVIDDAKAAGLAVGAPFSLSATFDFVLWPAFSLWFVITAVSFSGEVKNVQRSQLVGMIGAVVIMGATFALLMFLYRTAFGSDFLQAASNGTPLVGDPFTPLFTAVTGGNVWLTIVMSLWVVTIGAFVLGTAFVYPSRTLLAWSIDGMAPRKLGDVHPRFSSPHWALLVCAAVGLIVLALFCFTDLLGVISGFFGLAINFLVVCVWAIFFPFVRKETFENSPIAWRVGPIPVISIVGFLATAAIVPVMYRLLVDTTFSLNIPFMVFGAVGSLLAGAIWYVARRVYVKRQGVDLDKRYAEIPVE